jgi:hypothetical protein
MLEMPPAHATGWEPGVLYDLAQHGQGSEAIRRVTNEAEAQGGWTLAPGYQAVYDASIVFPCRAAVQVVDDPPMECSNPRLSRLSPDCDGSPIDTRLAQKVRFGPGLFMNPGPDQTLTPRPTFDDVLSTYIEEIAHSWQEYWFENQGTAVKPGRTSYEEWLYWKPGWEYQAKRYVLALDGLWLSLSALEHAALCADICDPNGYANPTRHHVAPADPPPGWPMPAAWPLTAPSADDWESFCAAGCR